MTRRPHTICWGVALAIGLALPIGAASTFAAGQSVPAPAPPGATTPPVSGPSAPPPPAKPAAPAPPYVVGWRQQIGEGAALLDRTLDLVVSSVGVVTAGQASAMQSRSLENGTVVWTSDQPSWRALTEGQGMIFGVAGLVTYALDSATGLVHWQAAVTEGVAHLVLGTDMLIVSTGSALTAIRPADGATAWRIDLGSAATTRPAVAGSTAAIGLANDRLVFLDTTTGAVRWQAEVFGTPEGVALGPLEAYVTLTDGTACAYRLTTGKFEWCFKLRIPIIGEPLLDANLLYLALYDNTLRAFDPRRGQLKQQERLGARPAAGARSAADAVFVPLQNGDLAFFAHKDGRPLPRVAPGPPSSSQNLQRAAISRDSSLIGMLTVAPSGSQALVLFRKAAPPPVAQTPPAAGPPTPAAPAAPTTPLK